MTLPIALAAIAVALSMLLCWGVVWWMMRPVILTMVEATAEMIGRLER